MIRIRHDGHQGSAVLLAPAIPNVVLGTAIFLATEVMFFAGLFSAYLIVRGGSGNWPPLLTPPLPVAVTALNTFALFCSGYLLQRGVRKYLERDTLDAVSKDLTHAAGLGTLFLVVQGIEWLKLMGQGLTTQSSRFAAIFYTLIGAHALHVLGALLVLVYLTRIVSRSGKPSSQHDASLRAMRMYWSFVVGLWPLLYVLLYLG